MRQKVEEPRNRQSVAHRRLPPWFTQKIPEPAALRRMERFLREKELHTVCESAMCPNMGQCFSRKTATFMILGDICTRQCTFCAVKKGTPSLPDPMEPSHICEAVKKLALNYVVVTSVTRDDLPDGGAFQFARVVEILHRLSIHIRTEVLIPDFRGDTRALSTVVDAGPDVINHNVETVPRLYAKVRPQAVYQRSLNIISSVKNTASKIVTKSGLMLGLGENPEEVISVMTDLRKMGCDLLTMGQYLQPSKNHHPVVEFIAPEVFSSYHDLAMSMGFKAVASGPLVRSSYRASELFTRAIF